jgi:hypothetical protein
VEDRARRRLALLVDKSPDVIRVVLREGLTIGYAFHRFEKRYAEIGETPMRVPFG